jgi:hypothetical protein
MTAQTAPAAVDAKPPKNPVELCTASTYTIPLGGTVTIAFEQDAKGPYFAFGASQGTLVVNGSKAFLNTADVPAEKYPILVFCSAVNAQGQTVSSTVSINTPPQPQPMVTKAVAAGPPPETKGFQVSGAIAPTLSWTTGTQTQTISGGSALVSAVHSSYYCDVHLQQFGLAANSSDTSTTKASSSTTTYLDNNDVKANATTAVGRNGSTRAYLGAEADYFGNNSFGLGLQQAYTAQFQFYLRKCSSGPPSAPPFTDSRRLFASVGIGAGYINQRLYATQGKLSAGILPLSAKVSYLGGKRTGLAPKFIFYGLLGYMPVFTDARVYQLSAIGGVQIPTGISWMTLNLSDSDLYMNNAPSAFKRNYQNGTVALTFTFPPPPAKKANPSVAASENGACYGGDKLSRLYCFDSVTADACAPPNIFRVRQHCSSSGPLPSFDQQLHTLEQIQLNQQ